MTWSNLRFNVSRSLVTMATNLSSCFSIQFLEQLLKFLVNFTLLKYVKSQRSYGFLVTKELIFGFQILDLKDHFSASLTLFRPGFFYRLKVQGGSLGTFLMISGTIKTNPMKLCTVIVLLKTYQKTKRNFQKYEL